MPSDNGPWAKVHHMVLDCCAEKKALGSAGVSVYCSLVRHANNITGIAWPSVPTIAKETGLSDRKVQFVLHALEDNGLIKAVEKHHGQSVKYRVILLGND